MSLVTGLLQMAPAGATPEGGEEVLSGMKQGGQITSSDADNVETATPSCATSESGGDDHGETTTPSCATSESGAGMESKNQSDAEDEEEESEDESEEEDEEEEKARIQALKDGPLPSRGSVGHWEGECKRCCFFPKGRCTNGEDCEFCHFDHEKRIRKKKKKKSKKAKRIAAKALAAAAAAALAAEKLRYPQTAADFHPEQQGFPAPPLPPQYQAGPPLGVPPCSMPWGAPVATEFSRSALRAKGAQVLEHFAAQPPPPPQAQVPTQPPVSGPVPVPQAPPVVPGVAMVDPYAIPPPMHHHVPIAGYPAAAHSIFVWPTEHLVPPPPPVPCSNTSNDSTSRSGSGTQTPEERPDEVEAKKVPVKENKPVVKEFPGECLKDPAWIAVQTNGDIPPIPSRPVPVKVAIKVSDTVGRIPPRPVPVKLRVSEPSPWKPFALSEELLVSAC